MITQEVIRTLRQIVGDRYVLVEKEDVIVYEQDGSIFQVMPEIVVLPAHVEQVSAVVKLAKEAQVPIVPRGSGTGLAGGAVAAERSEERRVGKEVRCRGETGPYSEK